MVERKVEVYKNGGWVACHPSEVKQGDLFRMYEGNGKLMEDMDGISQRVASKDAYQNESGIWTIEFLVNI